MRVNIYAEELTDRVEIISKEIEGQTFTALRFYLELPCTIPTKEGGDQNVRGPFIHRPGDDDSAAVTFWGKQAMQPLMANAMDQLNAHFQARGHSLTHLAITKDELREAFQTWERGHRNGKTRTHEETQSLPIEQVAQENADAFFEMLNGFKQF